MRRDEAPWTRERLRRAALWHVERYETTAARVRAALQRRVRRSVDAGLVDADAGRGWVDEVVAELVASGLVDDARFAEGAVRRMRDRGSSTQRIRSALAVKGVDEVRLDGALAADERGDDEAICRFAARRGFGPWRRVPASPERERKELAALGRAGFSYEAARRVVRARAPEELDAGPRGA